MAKRPPRYLAGSGISTEVPTPAQFVVVTWTCDDPDCRGACISPWYRKLAIPKGRATKGARLTAPHPAS